MQQLKIGIYQIEESISLRTLRAVLDTIKIRRYNTNWLSYISEKQLNHLNESFNLSMVGASGALYGIIVAFAFLFPNVSVKNYFS